jgi:hypothetical protein
VLTEGACRDLARLFTGHDYRVDAVVELIGEEAHRALGRNSTVPAVRTLAGRTDPLATLTRLWLLQQPVPRADMERALPELTAPLTAAGILAGQGDEVRALVDIRPHASDQGEFWVAADLTPTSTRRSPRSRPTTCSASRPPR